jgi:hypothetical protein
VDAYIARFADERDGDAIFRGGVLAECPEPAAA